MLRTAGRTRQCLGRAALVAGTVALLVGCDTGQATDNITPPGDPQTQFRVGNFVSDEPAGNINVIIDGVPYAANMAYGSVGATRPILTGSRGFRLVSTADEDNVIFEGELALTAANTAYTILFAGTGSEVQPIVMDDAASEPGDTQYRVRVVHAASSAGPVDIYVVDPGTDLSGATPVQIDAQIGGSASVLRNVDSASYVAITEAGTTTILAEGDVAAPDSAEARTLVLGEALGGGAPFTLGSFAF